MADVAQWKVIQFNKTGAGSKPVAQPFPTMAAANRWIDAHPEQSRLAVAPIVAPLHVKR